MSPTNEDFLFAQEAQRRGYVTEAQIEEGFLLQRRMIEELEIDERLATILVKRGWIAEEQARRVQARSEPGGGHDTIEGYRLVEKIGNGAMGTVYKAVHLGLQRTVAIKILRRDLAKDAIQVERLKEEAKLLASLDHPNIVRALDAGEARGFPYFVMEYVEGETLKDRLARKGPLPGDEALRITRSLADALERARRMGVVHRDVKPGNIILSKRGGEPKLMDLGLAKGPVDLGLTQHGATVGTPQYISPEQAQDPRKADTRSDIYSLGATLYAMVTGRPPFNGTTLAEVLTKVLYENPVPPRIVNKSVSPAVSYLIERMMLKDPALRYRIPAEVVHDIDSMLAGRSIVPPGFTGNWEAWLLRKRIRKVTKAVVLVAASVLLVGGGLFLWLGHRAAQEEMRVAVDTVSRTLVETELGSTDDPLSVQQKLLEARSVVERYRDLAPEPDGLAALRGRATALEAEARHFGELERLRRDVRELMDAGNYGEAHARLEALASRIPGTAGPAEREAATLRGDVRKASAEDWQRVRTQALRTPVHSLDALLEQQRALGTALHTGFIDTPALKAARDEAERLVEALSTVRSGVEDLERAYAPAVLDRALERLRFAPVLRDLGLRRDDVLRAARQTWQQLGQDASVPAEAVIPLLVARLDQLERVVKQRMHETGRRLVGEARDLHTEGRSEEAVRRLTALADAARDAGLSSLLQDAIDERDALRRDMELARERAAQDMQAIERDVLAFLREGRPEAIRERIAGVMKSAGPGWPYAAQVQGLDLLADALEQLHRAARDGLVARNVVDDVELRDGTREPRWTVVDVPADGASVVVTLGRRGGRVRRSLAEVVPLQLAEWATPPDGVLPPLVLAVAELASLPEKQPLDLRALVVSLGRINQAFLDAGYEGGLADWVRSRYSELRIEQGSRESNARTAISAAEMHIAREAYEDALVFLNRLLGPGSTLASTDAFEQRRDAIRELMAHVEKHVANLRLATRFPGARLGLVGDRTWLLLDWENPVQNEIFRSGEARAWGVREQYISEREVTPGTSNHRFHLLRGMDGLVRGLPLALPNLFEPAAPIDVQFDLWTGTSPFLLVVDVDGLQVGILSADPTSLAFRERWRFPPDVPTLSGTERPPEVDWYGRGRGVAFHYGKGFGTLSAWDWPQAGRGRNHDAWAASRLLGSELFAFEAGQRYHVRVYREGGRLTLEVDGRRIVSAEHDAWVGVGRNSDVGRVRNGTGLIQILTWTPMAIDNLRLEGTVLERFR